MKPVIIIVIAVVCSVGAVLGVLFVLQEIVTYQAQVAFDEYQMEIEAQKMKIVNKYNEEIGRCGTVFEYGNVLAKQQCETNAEKEFEVYLLDNEHKRMLKSSITSEEHLIYANKILEQIKKQNEEYFEQYP